MKDGPYSIGSDQWNGLSKLIEECGEVIQVAGKIIGNNGRDKHWDGSNLPGRLASELGDLRAAIAYVIKHNRKLDPLVVSNRRSEKLKKFDGWNENQK